MFHIIVCFLLIVFSLVGCSKGRENLNQKSEPPSVELTLPQIPKISPPYKPSSRDIQIALQNAGFYKGRIDGDIGPLTKTAIREFQAANGLEIDGVVGPKTWAVLSKYLLSPKETDLRQ